MRIAVWLSVLVALVIAVILLAARLAADAPASRTPATISEARAPVLAAPAVAAAPVSAIAAENVEPPPVEAAPPPTAAPTTSAAAAAVRARTKLHSRDGYSLLPLGGGDPQTRPYGGRSKEPTRRVHGRVVDARGRPVAGAAVLADRGFYIERDTIMALGGAMTDATGRFAIDDAPVKGCIAIAFLDGEWSASVPCSDDAIELRLRGHGTLEARFTYDGEPETFMLHLKHADGSVAGRFQTAADGRVTVASLLPGTYSARAGLAQSFGGGQSATQTKHIEIVGGETTSFELAFTSGTTVAVKGIVPPNSKPRGVTYWLFRDKAPRDGAEARARDDAEDAPTMSVGGGMKGDPVEFHDIEPGTYWACAAFFDPLAMAALDRPFGCARATVAAGTSVTEVTVTLAP